MDAKIPSINAQLEATEYIDFHKYWLVLKRRWIAATAVFVGITSVALIYSLRLPKTYEAEGELLIKTDQISELTGLENGRAEKEGLTHNSNPLATEAKIFRSRPIIEKLIQELNLQDDSGELLKYKSFVEAIKVNPVDDTDILQITYADQDPETAASVVNKAIELYIENDTLKNRSQTASAREFIAKELPKVEANVAQAEANLRRFKNQNRIASLAEETTATVGSISMVENQIDGLEAELGNVNARYNRLENQLRMSWQEAAAVSALSQSLPVQRALEQLQEVKVALAQKRDYLSDNAPQIVSLKEKEANLTTLLDRQIANTLNGQQQALIKNVNILSLGELKQEQIGEFADLGLSKEGLEKKLETLRNRYNSYKQRSDTLPKLQEQQRELERRVDAAQSTYKTLLSKLQEAQIVENQNIGNVQVVANAVVPEDPSGPRKKLIVAGGGVVGAFLGIMIAFLLDIRDNKIKNSQEVEGILAYPIHGIIPDFNKSGIKKQLLLAESSTSDLPKLAASSMSASCLTEAYQSLQIKLELLDKSAEQKVIAVTSSVAREGKSSISANLALAKVKCGQRTLLVDADLRCPTQHHLWHISNDLGLTGVLQEEVEWQAAIQNLMPNLDIITSGIDIDHPVSLLRSLQMEALICDLSSRYDCIIVDTPPLVGLADTLVLSKLVDGFLLVVRPGVADYASVSSVKKLLASSNLPVLGVVVNGVDGSKEAYGHR